ncbi:MAG: hypothetical protein GY772_01805, partial [bacterium]|nr:hypothetical protein [bacterium]
MESIFYTDGSVFGATDPAVARGGWAYSTAGGLASFGAMPGFAQTINRCELQAVVECASAHDRHLTICSDSSYVTAGAQLVGGGDSPLTNQDLWVQFAALPHAPVVRKVQAHLTPEEAALRGLSEIDRQGNAFADAAAKRGAGLHAWPEALASQRREAVEHALAVQEVHWRILQVILKAERRPFGAFRRARQFLRRPRERRGRPLLSHGAHQVVPSGSLFTCLLCQRQSCTARPRAWRYRPCLARVRRPANEVSASHLLWEDGGKVGCHFCGRSTGRRWKSRLLHSCCSGRGPRALPAFAIPLGPSAGPCDVEPVAFAEPLGSGATLVLDPIPSCPEGVAIPPHRRFLLPAEVSASHLLWEYAGRCGCLGCGRTMRVRDRHRLCSS